MLGNRSICNLNQEMDRMKTGQRMGSSYGKRPTTGIRAIGTPLKKETLANPTGESGFIPVNEGNNIKIANRPVTQHGLLGMKTQTSGPGRQV
jgi:hypothetical protein